MNCSFLKPIGIAVLLFSSSVYAEEPAKPVSESFQTVCTNAWMQKAGDAKDKVDYKNFGEKYCGCAAGQPLDNDAAVQKAIQVCMSRTLLHDAMDSLEDEVGLAKAKDTDVMEFCQDRWSLIYPKESDADKKQTDAYCECAKPKLMDLVKQADSMTDKQFDEGIDTVAAACSDNAVATNPKAAQ